MSFVYNFLGQKHITIQNKNYLPNFILKINQKENYPNKNYTVRDPEGRDHFKAILTSFRRRVLLNDTGKFESQNIMVFLFTK